MPATVNETDDVPEGDPVKPHGPWAAMVAYPTRKPPSMNPSSVSAPRW